MSLVMNNKTASMRIAVWEIDRLHEIAADQSHALPSFQLTQQRLAVSKLIEMVIGPGAQLQHDPFGKPFIKGMDCQISISHSAHLVAIMVDEKNQTGIDIQIHKDKITRLKKKFLSDKELNALAENETETLHVYWGAKEVLYKLYGKRGVDFRKDFFVYPFRYSQRGEIKATVKRPDCHKEYNIYYEKFKDSYLVYLKNY